jgi:hypothetical protein
MTPPRWFVLAAAALGIAFAVLYQAGVPLRSTYGARVNVDEPFYLLTTVSLLADRDIDLRNDYAERRYAAFFDGPELWLQSVPTADGRLLSPHNLGLPILLLPGYAAGGVDGAKSFLAILGGATVFLTALVAHRATGHPRAALAASALIGATAPMFVYATQVYPELPAALLVLACVWLILAERRGWLTVMGVALGITALAWLGVKYGTLGVALAVLAFVRLAPSRRIAFCAVLAASGLTYVSFHLATYGGLTPYSLNRLYAGGGLVDLLGQHLAIWGRLYRFLGLWIDAEFGLVRWAPVLLLAVPGALYLGRRRTPASWTCALLIGCQLLVAVFLSITMRGWWFPGRMLIVVLPLLAVPLAVVLARCVRRPLLTAAAALLGGYSVALTVALARATAAREVALAVDPFLLQWPPFRDLALLFPLYSEYTPVTWLLSAAWVLGIVVVVLAPRIHPRPWRIWRLRGATR